MDAGASARTALTWAPEGTRKRAEATYHLEDYVSGIKERWHHLGECRTNGEGRIAWKDLIETGPHVPLKVTVNKTACLPQNRS